MDTSLTKKILKKRFVKGHLKYATKQVLDPPGFFFQTTCKADFPKWLSPQPVEDEPEKQHNVRALLQFSVAFSGDWKCKHRPVSLDTSDFPGLPFTSLLAFGHKGSRAKVLPK